MRPEVTAFLLYSKGQEVLDPETFDKMQQERVSHSGIHFKEKTIKTMGG